MATQYTGGTTAGQILTAATMNSIGAAWETWTPTITATSGTFTTLTLNAARYGRIQNIVFGILDVTVTTLGTAANVMQFTVPVTLQRNPTVTGSWREANVTGEIGVFSSATTSVMELRRYDNGVYLATGKRFVGTFTYEAA